MSGDSSANSRLEAVSLMNQIDRSAAERSKMYGCLLARMLALFALSFVAPAQAKGDCSSALVGSESEEVSTAASGRVATVLSSSQSSSEKRSMAHQKLFTVAVNESVAGFSVREASREWLLSRDLFAELKEVQPTLDLLLVVVAPRTPKWLAERVDGWASEFFRTTRIISEDEFVRSWLRVATRNSRDSSNQIASALRGPKPETLDPSLGTERRSGSAALGENHNSRDGGGSRWDEYGSEP